MEDENQLKALRRRVKSERQAAGNRTVRFSERLKREVVSLLDGPDWVPTRLGPAVGVAPSVLNRWQKLSGSEAGNGRLRKVRVVREAKRANGELELEFPSGARVRGLTVEHLAKLVGGAS